MLLKLLLQSDEVHPQVVRVEELVLRDVLESLLVLIRALGGLPQQQPPCLHVPGQVAAFLVCVRARGDLHHEGRLALHEVREQCQVHRRPEVVRIRYEHVLESLRKKPLERPAAQHRRIKIAVARRAPLVARLRGPGSRGEVRRRHLRRFVLHELEVVAGAQVGILRERLQGVLGRRERVHQHKLQVLDLELRLHGLDLLGDEVQEGVALGHLEQGLRLLQAHARAKASIKLQDDRLLQELRVCLDLQLLVLG
mmetsp:Transcript_91271/g.178714  ORF Transcript_91271/g.178714 Transcript_91271/m.178714 type:complete len:253 (+) Transcript_91271:723-1481(+)